MAGGSSQTREGRRLEFKPTTWRHKVTGKHVWYITTAYLAGTTILYAVFTPVHPDSRPNMVMPYADFVDTHEQVTLGGEVLSEISWD